MKMSCMLRAAVLSCACTIFSAYAADDSAVAEAKAVADNLTRQLGGALKEALQIGGPAAAIGVCRDKAPALAGELSRNTGWRVSRISLRPRNALLGTADAWEQVALADMERRLAAGESADALVRAEVVEEPQGRYLRYLKPLPTQELCLSCHGPQESISAPVKDALARLYPHDVATGFASGRLRGAISIKRPL